ncbi:predicted protein [Sclerotinia sclerotiorum 1980 UF-70]|uniref:Uncharacterized protein n=1 Tax=Sclerotinia sclerotiorum (strain ATCC 18683 / 1980 / Ss-1) TaxID=665079 RepID=A7EHT7_SCLS1|nr:predicted protein [Sclerotinia sclerotiorum 1980 UF-70]EDO02403.1 predicted protein [Sclerotinia sclerotiorum 1980 UF-70]
MSKEKSLELGIKALKPYAQQIGRQEKARLVMGEALRKLCDAAKQEGKGRSGK